MTKEQAAKIKALKVAVADHMSKIQAAKAATEDIEREASEAIGILVDAAPPGTTFRFGDEVYKFRKHREAEGGHYYAVPVGSEL